MNHFDFRPSTLPTTPSYSWLGPQQNSSNEPPQASATAQCLTHPQTAHDNRPSLNAISNTNSFSTKCDINNVFKPLEIINNTTAAECVDDAKNDQLKLPQEQLTKYCTNKVIDSIETFINDDDIDNIETLASDKHISAIVNPVISELGQWLAFMKKYHEDFSL